MRLTEYTDYTLRVLMYCAQQRERLVTISELAQWHRLSRNHLMKIVSDLASQRILDTVRGRGGGVRLLLSPDEIRVGDIVRRCERDFRLVECFDQNTDTCTLSPTCRLRGLFESALAAYFRELDAATVSDLVAPLPRSGAAKRLHAQASVVPLVSTLNRRRVRERRDDQMSVRATRAPRASPPADASPHRRK